MWTNKQLLDEVFVWYRGITFLTNIKIVPAQLGKVLEVLITSQDEELSRLNFIKM